jgi:hypothetical protein
MGFHTPQFRIGNLLSCTTIGDIELADFKREGTEALA